MSEVAATNPSGAARPPVSPFGARNPDARARRIARALISDIIVYNPERRDQAIEQGTVRTEFKDEILKSWKEYVDQVGEDMARATPHFRNALNDLLAKGTKVF